MKKILSCLLTLVLALSLMGCGQVSENETKNEEPKKIEEKKETQEELNNKIKAEAVKANFVKINGGEMKGEAVFVEGEVAVLDKEEVIPTFMLSAKEGNGYGVYTIICIGKEIVNDINDGDKVKVYGKVGDKDEVGIPEISGNIIEKSE